MLDLSPPKLYRECIGAVSFRKQHTDVSARLIRRYAGDHYRADWAGDDSGDNYEAHEFEYQANTVPSYIFTNPAVEVKGLIPGVDDEIKATLDAAFPQWVESINIAEKLAPVAMDIGFDFGVTMVGVDVLPGYENVPDPKPLWPMIYRVSPRRFFMDPQATSFETARFMGHTWVQDKDDLLARMNPDGTPVFNAEAVNALVENDVEAANASVDKPPKDRIDRNQVTGYEVWCRETNMIYTLGASINGGEPDQYLREPRPFGGCPILGPYRLFGVYIVPDQLYPLPALAVTSGLVEELNAHDGQVAEQAGAAKKMVFIDSQNKQAKAAVVNGTNMGVYTVPGLASGGVQEVEFGGPSEKNLDYIRHLREHLDRKSGLTDVMRGNITGATATEVDEASQSADIRSRFARVKFRESVKVVFKQAAHFMIFNPAVSFIVTVKQPDPMTGEMVDVPMQYVGGMQEGQDPGAYQRLNIDIEPYSMEMVDQGLLQRRMAVVSEFVGGYGPIMPQTPWIKWKDMLDDIGETLNIKNAGSRYLDVANLTGATMLGLQQQQMGMQAEQEAAANGKPPKKGPGGPGGPPQRKAVMAR